MTLVLPRPALKVLSRRRQLAISGVALLLVGLYVALSVGPGKPGFPLDDAWIHQTYARNLAQYGRWQYTSDVASAGSTAPLWTLLLALGYWLRLPHLFWTYGLGSLCLVWLAFSGMALWRHLWPGQARLDWVAGLALVFTWPLVWAAASGMESLLFIAIALHILAKVCRPGHPIEGPVLVGLWSGLLILTRPEGLGLVLLVALAYLMAKESRRRRTIVLGLFLTAAAVPLLPYFAFNLSVSGALWPNTFYAKQAEYSVLLQQPLAPRALQLLYFSLGGPERGWRGMSGVHLLLLPGLLVSGWLAIRADLVERRGQRILPLLWAGGLVLLYAWRLPVTYQHGRYLWGALPVWILYGLAGSRLLLQKRSLAFMRLPRRTAWIVQRGAGLGFAAMALIFLLLGAQAYASDVAFVEGEMIAVAHWLKKNTPNDALIASHDIGAIGYFAERPLVDLAGLLSPELIPLLTDETALAGYLREHGAHYLVTAPGWPYHELTATDGTSLEYSSNYGWTQAQSLNNMAVYRLRWP